jgi:hypothetical protein
LDKSSVMVRIEDWYSLGAAGVTGAEGAGGTAGV